MGGHLLNNATDGFCEVDIETNIITSASERFEANLVNGKSIDGVCFSSFLPDEEQNFSEKMVVHTDSQSALRPVLVTCRRTDMTEFDAKLIPYTIRGRYLRFCLQIVGETREMASIMSGEAVALAGMHPYDFDLVTEGGSHSTEQTKNTSSELCSLAYSHSEPDKSQASIGLGTIHEHSRSRVSDRVDVGTQTLKFVLGKKDKDTQTLPSHDGDVTMGSRRMGDSVTQTSEIEGDDVGTGHRGLNEARCLCSETFLGTP